MKILNVFDNINLPIKMGIIGVLALAGLAFPSYYYAQLSFEIETASDIEIQGLQTATLVVELKKTMAEHRGLSATFLHGNTNIAASLNNKAREVDEQLEHIQLTLQERAPNSQVIYSANEIIAKWNAIRNRISSQQLKLDTSFLEHSQLLIETDWLMEEISNHFLLSYEHVAANYHTIIANFKNLPRLTDLLSAVSTSGSIALSSTDISATHKDAIRGYLNSITIPLHDYTHNMKKAAEFNDRFSDVNRSAQEVKANIEQLILLTNSKILEAKQTNYSSNNFFVEFSNVIRSLTDSNNKSVKTLISMLEERSASVARERVTALIVITLFLLISGFIGLVIVSSLKSSSNKLIHYFSEISKGNFKLPFNAHRKDEMGILEAELAKLTVQLEDKAEIAIESSKVKQALDKSSSCFMMSNAEREIEYMNDSVYQLLKNSETEIRKDLPQFNVETLIGTSLDYLLHNPSNKFKNQEELPNLHELSLVLGEYTFKLTINPIRDKEGNYLGNSVEWLDMTKIFEEERRITRILAALDNTSTNVMIANADRDIIYLNRSVNVMLKKNEAELRKELPHFTAAEVLGQNMDIFHKDPSHQKALLERLNDKYIAEINVGTQNFRLTANPISDANNQRIGTVVEWLDRTEEVLAQKEIATIVEASLSGDFTQRISTAGKENFMLMLAQGLNQLITTTESGLNEVSNVLLAISEGDLSKRVTSEYKGTFNNLKEYCNTTSENLANMISKIREASDTINNASIEIAQGNSDLSTRTEQQASSLEETASSMEELTSTVRLNAKNANQAKGLASQASLVAGNGGELIQQVVSTMASIKDSSTKISDIIGVIDGIAFQTNILALNAAVEAARAGEQGRGFAVVASEVRTLAQRSANAAKDIKDLISDSVSKVAIGNDLVSQSGNTMQEIVVSIQAVNDITEEIAIASDEQSSGIDEVSKAIIQMDQMTQQNAALVEEAAAAAESMRAQAFDLNKRMGSFTLKNGDTASDYVAVSTNAHSKHIEASPSRSVKKTKSMCTAMPAESKEDEWESF